MKERWKNIISIIIDFGLFTVFLFYCLAVWKIMFTFVVAIELKEITE